MISNRRLQLAVIFFAVHESKLRCARCRTSLASSLSVLRSQIWQGLQQGRGV